MNGTSQEDEVLFARLRDSVQIAGNRGRPHFVGFLNDRQSFLAENLMKQEAFKNYMLWGGWSGSERVVFGAFPEFLPPVGDVFPIVALTASYRTCDCLTHRDFMGALLANGITRETLGDILVEEGRAVLFVKEEVSDFILQQTEKIGRVGVRLFPGVQEPLPPVGRFEEFSGVVASARLDCVVALVCGLSREKAAAFIVSGAVMLNHKTAASVSVQVTQGANLSIRGKGRYVLDRVGPLTKKGRLGISGRKYV